MDGGAYCHQWPSIANIIFMYPTTSNSENQLKIQVNQTAKTYQIIPMVSNNYRVRAISSYFLVDRFPLDLATPAPDLRRVRELEVLLLESGGITKGDGR
jgi:hypothetical protein